MKSLKDLLNSKADQIDQSGVRSDMQLIQAELDRYFDGAVIVAKLKDSIATLETKNASLASTVRLQQTQLMEDLNSSLKNKLDRLIIRIV